MHHFFDNLTGDYKLTVGRKVFLYMTKEERAVFECSAIHGEKGEVGLRSRGVTGDLTCTLRGPVGVSRRSFLGGEIFMILEKN